VAIEILIVLVRMALLLATLTLSSLALAVDEAALVAAEVALAVALLLVSSKYVNLSISRLSCPFHWLCWPSLPSSEFNLIV
jgi:hypothetical protein